MSAGSARGYPTRSCRGTDNSSPTRASDRCSILEIVERNSRVSLSASDSASGGFGWQIICCTICADTISTTTSLSQRPLARRDGRLPSFAVRLTILTNPRESMSSAFFERTGATSLRPGFPRIAAHSIFLKRFRDGDFTADLWSGFPARQVNSSDIVFAQMLAPRHLEGWLRWLGKLSKARAPVLALHLGYDPWRFTHDRGVRRALARVNRSHPSLVHYITDSERLAPHYQKILGSQVDVLPHVVPSGLSSGPPRIRTGEIVFMCPGNPRREKGFVEFTSAIQRSSS